MLIWFHGGGWINGAGTDVQPTWLAAEGNVVVTVNYRLGALGYLALLPLDAEFGRQAFVAGVTGLIFALSGAFLSSHYENPRWDAFATVLIGVMLGALALLLVRETKGLLIGESADASLQRSISFLAAGQPGGDGVNGAFATHLAPDQIVVAISTRSRPCAGSSEISRPSVAIPSGSR